MLRIFHSPTPLVRITCGTLCVYIASWLTGCAGAPRRPEGNQLAQLQIRKYPAPLPAVFNAAVDAAQDLDFGVEVADLDAGVLSATTQTERELAKITNAEDGGLPTWAWVALIATGVIVIAAVVALLSSHGDEEKSESKVGSDDGTKNRRREGGENERELTSKSSLDGKVQLPNDPPERKDTVRVKYRTKHGEEPRHGRRVHPGSGDNYYYDYDEPDADFIVFGDDSPSETEWHQYRITLHFDNPREGETIVRLSAQGVRLEGEEVKEAGPVYEPRFYQRFFAALENSLRHALPDSTAK